MSIFKKKSFYIISGIVLLIVFAISFGQYQKANAPIEYDTVMVEQGNLKRTVEATGKLKAETDLSLRFETGGTLEVVKVKEGDKVKAGDLLANLRLLELNARVAKAQADLNQRLAGSTQAELDSLKAAVDNAKAGLDKAKTDAASSIAIAESDLATAKNNLNLAEGGDNSKIVNDAYDSAVAVLQKTSSVLDDGLNQADNVLGIDNPSVNDDFERFLGAQGDPSTVTLAETQYDTSKFTNRTAKDLILVLTTASLHADTDKAIVEAEKALAEMSKLLSYVADILTDTPPGVGGLTQSSLDTKKTNIATARSSVSGQYTSLIAERKAISDAKNSYTTYKIAYDKELNDLETAKANAKSSVAIKQAAYDQALANWQDKKNPPRSVDVAAFQAALAQAVANRNKAILTAPVDGVITKVNQKPGEAVSATDVVIELISSNYEIEVDVPETDVAKVNLDNKVTFTLDAFGDDVKFDGEMGSIDPKSTEIQDVVYYKVEILLDGKYNDKEIQGKRVKPGMTANVIIDTDDKGELKQVVYIPLRAVRSKNGSKFVQVLENQQVKDVPITLGSRADNGFIVVQTGLQAGQEVVLGVKE